MDTCVCMSEALCCPPEAITTLLMGYIPVSNKKLKTKQKRQVQLWRECGRHSPGVTKVEKITYSLDRKFLHHLDRFI